MYPPAVYFQIEALRETADARGALWCVMRYMIDRMPTPIQTVWDRGQDEIQVCVVRADGEGALALAVDLQSTATNAPLWPSPRDMVASSGTPALRIVAFQAGPPMETASISDDIRVEFYRMSHPNSSMIVHTDCCVRLTHIPTGITAACEYSRSRHHNHIEATRMLTGMIANGASTYLLGEAQAKALWAKS